MKKIFMRNIPENYTPAKKSCAGNPMYFNHAMRMFRGRPSGLGMNLVSEMMDNMFEALHNENGKGVEVERVGDDFKEVKNVINKLGGSR